MTNKMDKNSKDKKSPLDNIEVKPLSKEEVQALLEEGKNWTERLHNPPPPGDYELGFSKRGKKTKHVCSSCDGQIEAIYEVVFPEPAIFGPGGRGSWQLSRHRCSACKLVYDFS